MEDQLYQHHITIGKWHEDFVQRCEDHFTWLDEVYQVAAENYQKRDVEVLPKTPSAKRKTRRRKPPIVPSSEDDDFVDLPPTRAKQTRQAVKSVDFSSDDAVTTTASSALDNSDDGNSRSSRSTRSTRSARGSSSSKTTRSTRGKKAKGKAACDEELGSSMDSISEVDENLEKDTAKYAANLFGNSLASSKIDEMSEECDAQHNDQQKRSSGNTSTPKSCEVVSAEHVAKDCVTPDAALTTTVKSSTVTKSKTPGSAKLRGAPVLKKTPLLSTPIQKLKKALTPVSPKVELYKLNQSHNNSVELSDMAKSGDELDGSFSGLTVKDKVRAYNDMLTKHSPSLNRSVHSPVTSNTTYTSTLNVTLSNERLPTKSRVAKQVTRSPPVNAAAPMKRKSSVVVSRRSSVASRKSERLSQQASRMSLAKRKSFLIKNRTNMAPVVVIEVEPAVEEMVVDSPKPDLLKKAKTPVKSAAKSTRPSPLPSNSGRKRQLDSSSSNGSGKARKRLKSEEILRSPQVLKLKYDKSSDSEYVTDDSDVPMTPEYGQSMKRKFRTPPRVNTLIAQKTTPQSRSPGLSGSFIKRNTPKATVKERQEMIRKELMTKKAREERRLEKIRLQKQQELERQKRAREERHQKVQAKRLAQEKAQNQQCLTSVKSKEKRGSAIMREQKEKADLERQRRMKKQAEAEERRRMEEERRLQKIREKEEEQRVYQAMMQRKKEYEEQERQRRLLEEKRLAEEKRKEQERLELQRQREREDAAVRAAHNSSHNSSSLNTSSLNKSVSITLASELQSYNIDDIRSDDETDDEDAPKKEIPPWASGNRMKASMIHQLYKPPNIEEIFPPSILLVAPDLSVIFPKQRPRFQKRTSSAIWSPIQKHFVKNLV